MNVFQVNVRHGLSMALIAAIVACTLWIAYVAGSPEHAPLTGSQPAAKEATLEEIQLAPDYALRSPSLDRGETTARPLFNASRRPVPGAVKAGSAGASALQRGRYTLTGVSISTDRRVALLREVSTNKTVRVEQNKELNGMLLESVTPTKVTLKLGTEREEIPLKIAPATMAAVSAAHKPVQPGRAAPAGALPAITPLVRTPPAAAVAPGAPQVAADIADADPITDADVAERDARVRARRNRQSASEGSAPR